MTLLLLNVQGLQDKLTVTSEKVTELETHLSTERERAVSAEEHGKTVERQLAEEQQDSARLAKKREDAEAELATQVGHLHHVAELLSPHSACCQLYHCIPCEICGVLELTQAAELSDAVRLHWQDLLGCYAV